MGARGAARRDIEAPSVSQVEEDRQQSLKVRFKLRLLVGDDLEFTGLRTWLASEREKFEALRLSFVRQRPKANSDPSDELEQQLANLIEKAEEEIESHEQMLKFGKIFREAWEWRRRGHRRLRGLLKTIGQINSNLATIATSHEMRLENQRTLEAISQDIRAIGEDLRSNLEQMRVYANENEKKRPETKSEKASSPTSQVDQSYDNKGRNTFRSAVEDSDTKTTRNFFKHLPFNCSKPDTIADLYSVACVTLSSLSSLGHDIPYKGTDSCESAAMDLKRWALGFTKGELALDRILEDRSEGRRFLKACIVGALVDIIQMEGNMIEYMSKLVFKGGSRAQAERVQAMNENIKALLKRGDVICAAEDQFVPGLKAGNGEGKAESGFDDFLSALRFIQQTTTSLFDLVPAIRNLRQEKLLYLQKLNGLDRAKEEPLA